MDKPRIKNGSVSKRSWEIAYELIKDLILSLHIQPGEIVSENKLAIQLGIGRTPVREALKRLEQEGLIVSTNGRKRVYVLSVSDIEEIFDLKKTLEGSIAKWAAERAGKKDHSRLDQIVESMTQIADSKPSEPSQLEQWNNRYLAVDGEYHNLLAKIAGNRRAEQIVLNLNAQWHRLHLGILAIEGRIEKSAAEHRKIADAIIGHQPDKAEQCMIYHLENLKVMLVSIMKAFHYPSNPRRS